MFFQLASLTTPVFCSISKTSCLYPAKGFFAIITGSLVSLTLTASHLTAPLRSSSSLLANDDVKLLLVNASLHPGPGLVLSAPEKVHSFVLSMLQHSPFLPFPLFAHTKPQFLLRHLSSRLQFSLRAMPVSTFVW